VAGGDERPGLGLDRCGLGVALTEPLVDDGMEHQLSIGACIDGASARGAD